MASRAEQKAQARAERLARQQAHEGAVRRRQRRYQLAGAFALVVIAVVIAITVSSNATTAPNPRASGTGSQTARQVDQLLAGIPQAGNRLGRPTAPVTVTEFADLECPICQEFALAAENELIANDVRAGRVQLIYRALETATQDPTVFGTQQVAALAAGQQRRMWYYVELFYHEQGQEGSGYVTESYLDGLARQVPGLDYHQWLSARSAPSLTAQVQADAQQAATNAINATPTILVQGPRGAAQPIVGPPDYSQLEQAVQSVA